METPLVITSTILAPLPPLPALALCLTLFSVFLCLITKWALEYSSGRSATATNSSTNNGNSTYYGPREYPILGCLSEFYKNKRRILDWYTDLLSSSPAQTFVIRRLGARRTIITANPANVEHMLKTNFANYPKGQPFTDLLGDLLGKGIFNTDGEMWRAQRKLASHEFSARSLRDFVSTVVEDEVNRRLLPLLDTMRRDGAVVDMQDLLKRLAFDTICRVALGVDPESLDASLPVSELAKAFEVAAEICARRGTAVVPAVWKLKRLLGLGSEKMLQENVRIVHANIMHIINDKKQKLDDNNTTDHVRSSSDFLSRLTAAGNDTEVVRDMVISFVMAGRDTTSSALTWFFWLISRHPSIQEELVREAQNAYAARDERNNTAVQNAYEQSSDYQALRELRLLEACLMETMRLYPPVVWDSKHAAAPDTLPDGTAVRPGDRVTYFPYGMGRMEALWGKTATEFDPRRWLQDGAPKAVSPFKYPVFQAGPRVCLGKDMAFMQMKCVAAAVLLQFELGPVSNKTPTYVPLLTAHMAGGLRVIVKERDIGCPC